MSLGVSSATDESMLAPRIAVQTAQLQRLHHRIPRGYCSNSKTARTVDPQGKPDFSTRALLSLGFVSEH